MQAFDVFDGALLVDKPSGVTSHDVVDAIRREFRFKKVGHCGTLDPNATGLLIIVLGKGTKLSERLMGSDKVYEGDIELGVATDSYDSDGEVTATLPVPELTLEQLTAATVEFTGDIMQTPPMVSAIKKDGVPLYKLARKGVEVEREARLVHIHQFKILNYTAPLVQVRIACTKGTYIRSIAHEFGQKLGCGGSLKTLRRTMSGKFDIKDAATTKELLNMPLSDLEKRVIPFLKLAAIAAE